LAVNRNRENPGSGLKDLVDNNSTAAYYGSMKSLAVLGALALWLTVAVPFYCDHGFTTVWAASGHSHYAAPAGGAPAEIFDPDAAGEDPVVCQHHGSSADSALTLGSVDSDAGSLYAFATLGLSNGRLLSSGPPMPPGIRLSPSERPPSNTG